VESGFVPDGRMPIVEYLVNDKAFHHRIVLDVLLLEESHLGIHLPTREIARRVDETLAESELPPIGEAAVEDLLTFLHGRGNVDRIHNTRRFSTASDFLRRDYLYQLTPEGAQVHRHMTWISSEMRMSGALQSSMLPEVLDALAYLVGALEQVPIDLEAVDRNFHRLTSGFTKLSENAKLFVQGLNRSLAFEEELVIEAFLAYKQVVVGYLQTFIVALDRYGPRISGLIAQAEHAGVLDVLPQIAKRSPTPILGVPLEDVIEQEIRTLAAQWAGIRSWFFESQDRPPVAYTLQDRASDAVNHIVLTVRQINEQRYRRANRSADLVTLASWFGGTEDQRERAALWRTAFGMYSARHLGTTRPLEADEDHAPELSWWDSSPAPVSAALRGSGPRTTSGSPPSVGDPRKAKSRLAGRRRLHIQAADAAERSFAARGRFRLSDLEGLTPPEADVLLSCLDSTLAVKPGPDGVRRTTTGDGRMRLELAPPEEGSRASISMRGGILQIEDFELFVCILAQEEA
jgi:uncharacterized protein (TIGR02677 family)